MYPLMVMYHVYQENYLPRTRVSHCQKHPQLVDHFPRGWGRVAQNLKTLGILTKMSTTPSVTTLQKPSPWLHFVAGG